MKWIQYYFFPKTYCNKYGHTPGTLNDEPHCFVCGIWVLHLPKTDPWYIKWSKEFIKSKEFINFKRIKNEKQ